MVNSGDAEMASGGAAAARWSPNTVRGVQRIAERLRLRERLIGLGLAVACGGVLLVGRGLEPAGTSGDAVGTHTALGLPACGFLEVTGLPCLTCGMTTSTALAARGELLSSLTVQPAGLFFALLMALGVTVGVWSTGSGMSLLPLWRGLWRPGVVWSAMALLAGAWVYKLMATVV